MKMLSLYCRVTVALLMVVSCGGERALEAGVRVGLITPGSIADAAWNAGAYHHLVFGHGLEFQGPAERVARDYPPGLDEWMDAVRDSMATGTLSPPTAPAGDVP